MAKSIDSRLVSIEKHLTERGLVRRLTLSRDERMEFAQLLVAEIVVQGVETGQNRDHFDRFDRLPDLDKRAVRNVVFGLRCYGWPESDNHRKSVDEWLGGWRPTR